MRNPLVEPSLDVPPCWSAPDTADEVTDSEQIPDDAESRDEQRAEQAARVGHRIVITLAAVALPWAAWQLWRLS